MNGRHTASILGGIFLACANLCAQQALAGLPGGGGAGLLPTTIDDFKQPGTQPGYLGGASITDPVICRDCHLLTMYRPYSAAKERVFKWEGSMMANASKDPLFDACLAIAEQDAPGSGDLCDPDETCTGSAGQPCPSDWSMSR